MSNVRRRIFVYGTYALGHALSKLPGFLAWAWYRPYNWLMWRSSDADKGGWLWYSREQWEEKQREQNQR